ncbi:MAG: hypothetical protein AB9880_03665 [Christensenellales bacterium]
MEQNRFKSPVFWGGIVALVLNFLIAIEVITPAQSQAVNDVFKALLTAFAAFAVANNPTVSDRL